MADKKISQLSSATAPLAGTEVIPIVQASETKKVTVSGLFTAYTFTTSATGPLVIGGTGATSTLTLRATSGVGTTGSAVIFQVGNNGATEAMRILNGGAVGIGTSSPFTVADSASARATTLNSIALFNSMPLSVTDTTAYAAGVGGGINFRARLTSSTYATYAAIWSYREAASNNDYKGSLIFATSDNGNGYPTERAKIDSSGNLLITAAGGLGYGTGSGGAVTQDTSRTTGVTINKTNGAITLVSAAGTTTWQTFTVTNSTVAATDTIIVSQKSGTDLYEIHVTTVAAGSFKLTYRTTGGTTTEQPVFNFSVIKAATS